MSTGFSEPLVHAGRFAKNYGYRTKMGITPSKEYYHFFDDFFSTPATNVPPGWKAFVGDAAAAITNDSLAGGQIKITDADASQGASVWLDKCVKLDDKSFYMECNVALSDVTDHTFYFGLTDLAAIVNPEDLWDASASDVIACGIADGSGQLKLLYNKDGSTDTDDVSTDSAGLLVATTYHTLAFRVDGNATDSNMRITAWVDGVRVITSTTETNVPEDVVLAPFIGSVNGNGAGGNTAHVDYLRFVGER